MSKIRALNEYESGSESDDDANRKLSKEAQEEFAKLKYNQALKTFSEGNKHKAAKLFENLLEDPYLNEDDSKQLTPSQCQLILGCLKILADLYRDGSCQNLHRAKLLYARAISFDQFENVNLWFRLGTVSLQTGDLYTAYTAFDAALRLRPSHWKCIENLVTVSFALQSFQNCLQFCAIGLAKDPCFIKGHVFRDMVYEIMPELKGVKLDRNEQALSLTAEFDNTWKEKYCAELREIRQLEKEKVLSVQLEVEKLKRTNKIHFNLRSWSLIDVVTEVITAYQASSNSHEFHNTVDLTFSVQDSCFDDEFSVPPPFPEESQTEEESSLSGVRQSRSSSDDKDPNANTQPGAGSASEDADKNGDASQPPESQSQTADDSKKKNKRDVKWWQIEGKRRSQRVRGHLMPASPDKAKKENCFVDQLKALIPSSLLGDDGSIIEKESAAAAEKSTWQTKAHIPNYFGTKEEETDVKSLLAKLTGVSLSTMLIHTTTFLANKIKYPWPGELRELFLILYNYYRSHVPFPDLRTYHLDRIIRDAFVCLAFAEIIVEKYKEELQFDVEMQISLRTELDFIDEVLQSKELPQDYDFRVKWLTGRRLLQITHSDPSNVQANSLVSQVLSNLEHKLEDTPMIIWSVNESSNLICLESVREKSAGFTKMQNSQVITDLYKNSQFEELINVLKSGINFSEIEKRDLPDLFYYSVALFGTQKVECVCQCLNLVHHSIRLEDNSVLADAVMLLESIWTSMKGNFTWQNKRSTVGYLVKILVSCDRQPPVEQSIVSVSWCILHNILFTLEKTEPAFYMEEETVPNSILLLQLAHECLARSESCCVYAGKLMLYIIKAVLQVKNREEYFAFEETRHSGEQAIYCLYAHPSKRSKVKNLKDHASPGITLSWEICPILYEYYFPTELPEFDSYGSIGAEVECLFQRFLELMPSEVEPRERQKTIRGAIQNSENITLEAHSFPKDLTDIYYLIGDYHFKTKEWAKAVTYYTWDLAVNIGRFDSWAAIALSLGETINTTLNTADIIEFKELLKEAQSTAYCFRNALKIQPGNIKLRIEFGSFVYAMHAYCSRQMKQHAAEMDMELFHVIEEAKEDFLQSAIKCFESVAMKHGGETDEEVEDELWIHHYMLGKIYEKTLLPEEAKEYLNQYELAGRLLHDQGAPYPNKMNYYSPPELAIEALEIYYRIHATILTLIEKPGSACDERFYLEFIRRQVNGPFVKNKQGKGDGGESKKGRKATEDTVSKKELSDISALLSDLVNKTAETCAAESSASTSSSSSSSEDDTSSDSIQSVQKRNVNSFCLAAFQKRLHEKELREVKIATEAQKPAPCPSPSPPPVNIYDGLKLDDNHFYQDFKSVKFGAVIAMCLKAMEECILRYPSHSKSYYRIAHSYIVFLKDATKAKEYLMGSATLQQKKISGLFGERKPTNFFNGIWRNPIDDIDRPGSFSYHMNKTMQLLLDVLSSSNEHAILAEVVVQLSKVPDNEKKYLSNPDREQFCQQALSSCVAAVKRKQLEPGVNLHELGLEVLETFTKLQKHSTRMNPLGNVLFEIYKAYLKTTGVSDEAATIEHALRYFNLHAMALKPGRNAAKAGTDPKGGEVRKRGRRATRQVSQEFVPNPTPASSLPHMNMLSDLSQFQTMAAIYQSFGQQSMLNMSQGSLNNVYPQLNVDAVQSGFNANLQSYAMAVKTGTPPPAHGVRNIQFGGVRLPKKGPSQHPQGPQGPPVKQHKPGNMPMNFAKRAMPPLTHAPGTGPSVVARPDKSKEKVFLAKKSTGQGQIQKQKHVPPPPPSEHPIRINTSPYKAQSTVVEQPPAFLFAKQAEQVPVATKKPPIAHYHPNPKPPQVSEETEEMDVEVIDLTIRTPEKQPKVQNAAEEIPKKLPRVQNVLERLVDKPPRMQNFLERASDKPPKMLNVLERASDKPPKMQNFMERASDKPPKMQNFMERASDKPPKMQKIAEKVPEKLYNPVPVASASRPGAYPLPPKKKHHQILFQSVEEPPPPPPQPQPQVNLPDDVEVIFLD